MNQVDLYMDGVVDASSLGVDLVQLRRKEWASNGTADAVTSTVSTISSLLSTFQSLLPTVIADLKYAKKEVSAVSKTLDTVFSGFKTKGSPIFQTVASLYKTLW